MTSFWAHERNSNTKKEGLHFILFCVDGRTINILISYLKNYPLSFEKEKEIPRKKNKFDILYRFTPRPQSKVVSRQLCPILYLSSSRQKRVTTTRFRRRVVYCTETDLSCVKSFFTEICFLYYLFSTLSPD